MHWLKVEKVKALELQQHPLWTVIIIGKKAHRLF